jgi:hypothetical protein
VGPAGAKVAHDGLAGAIGLAKQREAIGTLRRGLDGAVDLPARGGVLVEHGGRQAELGRHGCGGHACRSGADNGEIQLAHGVTGVGRA